MSRARRALRRPGIASLVPSLTELVFALGLGEHLVARTGWCIHPPAASPRVPKVGGTKTVNLAKLRRLAPTHLLVNVDENRRETIEAVRAWGGDAPEIVVTHPLDPEDNVGLVAQLEAEFAVAPALRSTPAHCAWRCNASWRDRGRPAGRIGASLPDLARAVDDGRARHLPFAHAGADRLADLAGASAATPARRATRR